MQITKRSPQFAIAAVIAALCLAIGLTLSASHLAWAAAEAPATGDIQGKVIKKSGSTVLVKRDGDCYAYTKGEPLTETWKKIGGKRYYFDSKGRAVTGSAKIDGERYVFTDQGRLITPKKDKIVQVQDDYYFVTPQGTTAKGYHVIGDKLYYSDSTGRCAANEKIDGIPFGKDAAAKPKSTKAKAYLVAYKKIKSITTDDMTRYQKLKKCWAYAVSAQFKANCFPNKKNKAWKYQCAVDALTKRVANCYGFSFGFAVMAKVLGYDPYVIEIPHCHCWTKIGDQYWDNMMGMEPHSHGKSSYKPNQIKKFW